MSSVTSIRNSLSVVVDPGAHVSGPVLDGVGDQLGDGE